MSTLLITHNDLDGIGVALLAIRNCKFDSIIICGYGDINRDLINECKQFKTVIVADLTIPEHLILPNMRILDHHPQDIVNDKITVETDECGTSLFYKYIVKSECKNEAQDKFVELVKSFDIWQSESPYFNEALDLQKIFIHLTRDIFKVKCHIVRNGKPVVSRWTKLLFKFRTHLEMLEFTNEEKEIIQFENNVITKRMNEIKTGMKLKTILINETSYKYFEFEQKSAVDLSFISHQIMEKTPELEFVRIIFPDGKSSLRSKSLDLHCFKNAGGHPNACYLKGVKLELRE